MPLTISFVMGTSSSLFNAALLNLPSGNESAAQQLVESVLQAFNKSENDIALYPNPFKSVNSSNNSVSGDSYLSLVDGVFPHDLISHLY
jgi:lysophospholipase